MAKRRWFDWWPVFIPAIGVLIVAALRFSGLEVSAWWYMAIIFVIAVAGFWAGVRYKYEIVLKRDQ